MFFFNGEVILLYLSTTTTKYYWFSTFALHHYEIIYANRLFFNIKFLKGKTCIGSTNKLLKFLAPKNVGHSQNHFKKLLTSISQSLWRYGNRVTAMKVRKEAETYQKIWSWLWLLSEWREQRTSSIKRKIDFVAIARTY